MDFIKHAFTTVGVISRMFGPYRTLIHVDSEMILWESVQRRTAKEFVCYHVRAVATPCVTHTSLSTFADES